MPNELNQLIERELSRKYPAAGDLVVVGFERLSGQENADLRRTLREGGVRLEVVKNSMARRVLEANGLGKAASFLDGPCALATGNVEMPQLCKILADCVKKFEDRFTIRGAVMAGSAIRSGTVVELARIPPLPVLYARFIGSVQAPVSRMAGAFQAILRNLACALEGIREKKESSGPPPVPGADASGPAPGEA